MQRIDENTYIDDTLVTCAEYQLFIDEMRENEKYYQPDHWMAYQFAEGQAREPILGVRHSDAVAFCEWLTQRGKWKYRLLNQEEAIRYPLKSLEMGQLGYWLYGRFQFEWVGSVPTDMRRIDLEEISGLGRELILLIYRALDQARVRPLDLKFTADIVRAIDLNYARDVAVDNVLERNLVNRDRLIDLKFALNRTLEIKHTRDLSFNRASDRVLDLYVDLFALQQRLAGRSPAFEGIRLVKERIR